MSQAPGADGSRNRSTWWLDQDLALVLVLAILTFCLRLTAIPLFGEEPRRALIAREMVETGNWLVPETQGVYLPSRPPLQNWMIAGMAAVLGAYDVWAVRLPSILCTTLTAVMIYGYLRQSIAPLGSMGGAAAFVTMLLVMEFGRSAETEAVFTLFVAASMMLWHWGWLRRWPAWQMWSVGYACTALGMLTKGLQAPIYFVGSAVLFLLLTGNWKSLFTRGHAVGIAMFVVVLGLWQVPFTIQRGWPDSWMMYFGDVAGRFTDRSWSTFLAHLVAYPVELVGVRLMPWSVLLLAYGSRRIRSSLGPARETVLFLTICVAFSFIFVWLPPGSKARYFMPLFPSFAALVGIAIDRLAVEHDAVGESNLWANYVRCLVWLMIGTAIFVPCVSFLRPGLIVSLPQGGALLFCAGTLCLAAIAWRSLAEWSEASMGRGVLSIAAFMALLQVGLITTIQQRRCEDIAGHVEEIKQQLPPNTRLVSLGLVHHAFAFFYGQAIPIVESPTELPDDQDYFCLHTYAAEPPKLPFAWARLAVVSCDRFHTDGVPKDRVFIGRRLRQHEVGMRID